jgi:hypothetical protein
MDNNRYSTRAEKTAAEQAMAEENAGLKASLDHTIVQLAKERDRADKFQALFESFRGPR